MGQELAYGMINVIDFFSRHHGCGWALIVSIALVLVARVAFVYNKKSWFYEK